VQDCLAWLVTRHDGIHGLGRPPAAGSGVVGVSSSGMASSSTATWVSSVNWSAERSGPTHSRLTIRYWPLCIPGLLTIDHIAVPQSARIHAVNRIVAEDHSGKRLSDHDAYAIDVTAS